MKIYKNRLRNSQDNKQKLIRKRDKLEQDLGLMKEEMEKAVDDLEEDNTRLEAQ